MENLTNIKKVISASNAYGKPLILEMIKETEIAIKKEPEKEKILLIFLHDEVNKLVISDPDVSLFKIMKSRMDNLIEELR